jgi:hypothetical protein
MMPMSMVYPWTSFPLPRLTCVSFVLMLRGALHKGVADSYCTSSLPEHTEVLFAHLEIIPERDTRTRGYNQGTMDYGKTV